MVNLDSGLKVNIINTRLVQKLRLNRYYPLPYILRNFGGEFVNPVRICYITFEIINATGYT